MKSYIVDFLETERLAFRRLKKSDTEAWMEYFASQEAIKFMHLTQNSRMQCEGWIQRQLFRYEATESGLCAVIEKESEELVGQIGLLTQEVDGVQELEIGYHLIPRFWKRGFALEGAMAVRDAVFKNKLANSLISIINVENRNSQKVAERNGMKIDRRTTFRGDPVFIYRINKL